MWREATMTKDVSTSGTERFFYDDDIIVSKTNLKGHLTYANKMFLDIADFRENEVLGQPHNIIRHPDMPRCIFKLLWDTILSGQEIFAYVINRCKHGDHYWVYAHVTPSKDVNGNIIGYHSSRRVPDRKILEDTIMPLYIKLKAAEDQHQNRKQGLEVSQSIITKFLSERCLEYDEFIMTLGQSARRGYR